RENAWNDADRFHIALTYKPFENTTIRYSYDEADYGRSFQRRWIVRDGVSDWIAAGSNFVNYNDFVRDGAVDWGLVRDRVDEIEGNISTGDRPTVLWTPSGLTGRNFKYASRSTGTGDQWVDFEREGWNRKDGLAGPVNTTDTKEDSVMLIVEQELFENFFIEGAYRSENFNRQLRDNANHGDIEPFIDLAQVLPDGSANPYFGHYFIETRPQRNSIHKSFETKRLLASYEWDSGKKWLGRHQLAALWQNEVKFTRFARARLANRTPLNPSRNNVGQNRLYTRTYINSYRNDGPDGMAVDLVANPIAPFTLTDPVTGENIGTITPEFIWDRNRPNKADTTSMMVGGQSFFWEDKIALVYGVRKDELESFGFVETKGQAGQLPDEVTLGELQDEAREFEGETKSLGIAVTPFEWLTLTANKSDNFQPQTQFNVFNELAGNKTATGEDYSIRLNLWDGKLYASLNFYETVVDNETNNSFWFWTKVNPIWEALEASNLVSNPAYVIENGVTVKSTTGEGTEFELVANPTKNITLRFNMSDRDVAVSDVNPHVTRYLSLHTSTWNQFRDVILLEDENETVGSMADRVVQENEDRRQEIGGREGNTIEKRMNFFGKYTFDQDSFLGGFDVGVGAKFYGDRYLGIQDGSDVYFEDYSVWQLKVGYKRPLTLFGNEVDMKLSLNISNLFDNDLIIVTSWGNREIGGPIARNITTLDARTTTLRATFSF
ncbi:MAG: hypothetical protein MI748_03200, partial [Opitutales bacterium]|nr:hypothetical protein [Opitutales bacterium]